MQMCKSIHASRNSGSFTENHLRGVARQVCPTHGQNIAQPYLGVTRVSSSVGWSILQVVKV